MPWGDSEACVPMTLGAQLVGRELALADLRRTAEGAESGSACVAVVEGISGIGKSVLAQHFTAELGSWRVVRVRSDPEDSVNSFGAVRAILRALTSEQCEEAFQTAADAAVGLFAALDRIAAPVCLHVEDAQWLDVDSEETLLTVARQGHHARVLLLVDSQPTPMGLAARLYRTASRVDGGALIQLEPFGGEDLRKLFLRRLGTTLDYAAADSLLQATGGLPVYVDSLIRRLESGGGAGRSLNRGISDLLAASLSIGAFVFYPLWLIPPAVSVALNVRTALSMKNRTGRDVLFAMLFVPGEIYMWIKIGHFIRAWMQFFFRSGNTDNWSAQAAAESGKGGSAYLQPLLFGAVLLSAVVLFVDQYAVVRPRSRSLVRLADAGGPHCHSDSENVAAPVQAPSWIHRMSRRDDEFSRENSAGWTPSVGWGPPS